MIGFNRAVGLMALFFNAVCLLTCVAPTVVLADDDRVVVRHAIRVGGDKVMVNKDAYIFFDERGFDAQVMLNGTVISDSSSAIPIAPLLKPGRNVLEVQATPEDRKDDKLVGYGVALFVKGTQDPRFHDYFVFINKVRKSVFQDVAGANVLLDKTWVGKSKDAKKRSIRYVFSGKKLGRWVAENPLQFAYELKSQAITADIALNDVQLRSLRLYVLDGGGCPQQTVDDYRLKGEKRYLYRGANQFQIDLPPKSELPCADAAVHFVITTPTVKPTIIEQNGKRVYRPHYGIPERKKTVLILRPNETHFSRHIVNLTLLSKKPRSWQRADKIILNDAARAGIRDALQATIDVLVTGDKKRIASHLHAYLGELSELGLERNYDELRAWMSAHDFEKGWILPEEELDFELKLGDRVVEVSKKDGYSIYRFHRAPPEGSTIPRMYKGAPFVFPFGVMRKRGKYVPVY